MRRLPSSTLTVPASHDLRLLTDKFSRCQRCHAHKIKCSGDQPCSKCRAVGCAEECAYASRDRQVKVSEKYGYRSPLPSRATAARACFLF